jgi:hypothetical protein
LRTAARRQAIEGDERVESTLAIGGVGVRSTPRVSSALMRAVRCALALALPLSACSLGYLTQHAGEAAGGDIGDGGAGTERMGGDGAARDGVTSESASRDAAGSDGVGSDRSAPEGAAGDAGWSPWADASMGFADLASVWGSDGGVWAVGYNTIVYFDGGKWSVWPAAVGPLNAVWGSSSRDVWAVGQAGSIVRFDGTAWLPSDAGASATLNGVWGTAADDVWTVGEELDGGGTVLHWDGTQWSRSATLAHGLQGVWGSANLVWAVGNRNLISEYAGGSWSTQVNQATVPDDLASLWGSSQTSIWAVSPNGPTVYYGGDQNVWTVAPSGFGLNCVWGSGESDVWGVGFGGSIAHYDGTAWSLVPSGTTAQLNGVWGSGPDDVWAVGTGGTILHHP